MEAEEDVIMESQDPVSDVIMEAEESESDEDITFQDFRDDDEPPEDELLVAFCCAEEAEASGPPPDATLGLRRREETGRSSSDGAAAASSSDGAAAAGSSSFAVVVNPSSSTPADPVRQPGAKQTRPALEDVLVSIADETLAGSSRTSDKRFWRLYELPGNRRVLVNHGTNERIDVSDVFNGKAELKFGVAQGTTLDAAYLVGPPGTGRPIWLRELPVPPRYQLREVPGSDSKPPTSFVWDAHKKQRIYIKASHRHGFARFLDLDGLEEGAADSTVLEAHIQRYQDAPGPRVYWTLSYPLAAVCGDYLEWRNMKRNLDNAKASLGRMGLETPPRGFFLAPQREVPEWKQTAGELFENAESWSGTTAATLYFTERITRGRVGKMATPAAKGKEREDGVQAEEEGEEQEERAPEHDGQKMLHKSQRLLRSFVAKVLGSARIDPGKVWEISCNCPEAPADERMVVHMTGTAPSRVEVLSTPRGRREKAPCLFAKYLCKDFDLGQPCSLSEMIGVAFDYCGNMTGRWAPHGAWARSFLGKIFALVENEVEDLSAMEDEGDGRCPLWSSDTTRAALSLPLLHGRRGKVRAIPLGVKLAYQATCAMCVPGPLCRRHGFPRRWGGGRRWDSCRIYGPPSAVTSFGRCGLGCPVWSPALWACSVYAPLRTPGVRHCAVCTSPTTASGGAESRQCQPFSCSSPTGCPRHRHACGSPQLFWRWSFSKVFCNSYLAPRLVTFECGRGPKFLLDLRVHHESLCGGEAGAEAEDAARAGGSQRGRRPRLRPGPSNCRGGAGTSAT